MIIFCTGTKEFKYWSQITKSIKLVSQQMRQWSHALKRYVNRYLACAHRVTKAVFIDEFSWLKLMPLRLVQKEMVLSSCHLEPSNVAIHSLTWWATGVDPRTTHLIACNVRTVPVNIRATSRKGPTPWPTCPPGQGGRESGCGLNSRQPSGSSVGPPYNEGFFYDRSYLAYNLGSNETKR